MIGTVSIVLGVLDLLHPIWPAQPWWFATAGVDGVVAGVIFLGFALEELVRRLRHGPQEPGRHARR